MMKKLLLGIVVCCGIDGVSGMQSGIQDSIQHERRHSDSDVYMATKAKLSWALPKSGQSRTTEDIDEALRCVGTNFSQQNLDNLFSKLAKNSAYANYVHLMFDECYAGNSSSWIFAYISSVLSHAAICYGLQRAFDSEYLSKMFRDSVDTDDWGLKT